MNVQRKTLLIGDSFFKRLANYRHCALQDSQWYVHDTVVDLVGFPGKGVGYLQEYLRSLSPGIYSVVINCGSNDLCKRSVTAASLVQKLFSIADFLIRNGRAKRLSLFNYCKELGLVHAILRFH